MRGRSGYLLFAFLFVIVLVYEHLIVCLTGTIIRAEVKSSQAEPHYVPECERTGSGDRFCRGLVM